MLVAKTYSKSFIYLICCIPLLAFAQPQTSLYEPVGVMQCLFFGFMMAMATGNFLLFLTTRSINFLVYCGYAISIAMVASNLNGLDILFWPRDSWISRGAIGLFGNLALIFVVLFTRFILDTKTHTPIITKLLDITAAIVAVNLLVSLFISPELTLKLLLILAILVVNGIIFISISIWRKGDALAPFYSVAWLVLLSSLLLLSVNLIHDLGVQNATIFMAGSMIETIILSLVLALRYKYQIEEAEAAQQLALENEIKAREAQNETLQVQQEAQEELEYKVDERTFELKIALQELEDVNKKLAEQNTLDALTGIKNRAYFDKKYFAEFKRSRREQTPLSILMIDIDHFKSVNDNYGHLVGDDCIRFVALTLTQHLHRPSDDACRYGGEEFSLILPATDESGAKSLAEKIRAFIEQHPIPTPSVDVKVTISIGIASGVISSDIDEAEFLDKADKALYQAKQGGRNQVVVFQE